MRTHYETDQPTIAGPAPCGVTRWLADAPLTKDRALVTCESCVRWLARNLGPLPKAVRPAPPLRDRKPLKRLLPITEGMSALEALNNLRAVRSIDGLDMHDACSRAAIRLNADALHALAADSLRRSLADDANAVLDKQAPREGKGGRKPVGDRSTELAASASQLDPAQDREAVSC